MSNRSRPTPLKWRSPINVQPVAAGCALTSLIKRSGPGPIILSCLLMLTNLGAGAQQIAVYAHDPSGMPLPGYTDSDRATLVGAAMSGHRIAVRIGNDDDAQIFRGYIMQEYPRPSAPDLCMMVTLFALNINSTGDDFTARKNPYSGNFCSDGHEYLINPSNASNVILNNLPFVWFAVP